MPTREEGIGSMKRATLALAVAVTVVAAAGFIPPAHGADASKWYWTPGACKSELRSYGVQLGDGRIFHVAGAYCVGLHNHCYLSSGVRHYKVFTAVARSYDNIVRRFQLTVTGKDSWSGTPPRIIDHLSAAQFTATYGPAAWTVATSENQGGCFDIHP
jgi:hypothetical protein